MSYEVEAEIVEGNDVWFAHRVQLQDGSYLQKSDLLTSTTALTVTVYRATPAGNRLRAMRTSNYSESQVDDIIYDGLIFDYWNGKDDRGYNLHWQLQSDDGTSQLEGANVYIVEFRIRTKVNGELRWANRVQVAGTVSV